MLIIIFQYVSKSRSAMASSTGIICPKCSRRTIEPQYFPCGHMTCHRCTIEWHNEHRNTGNRNELSCPTCCKMVPITSGRVRAIPMQHQISVDETYLTLPPASEGRSRAPLLASCHSKSLDAASVSSTHSTNSKRYDTVSSSSTYSSHSRSSDTASVCSSNSGHSIYETISIEFSGAHLRWHKSADSHIWDIDFLADGTIVYIKSKASGDVSRKELASMNLKGIAPVTLRKLKRINIKGSKLDMEPPVLFNDPAGVSTNHAINSVAVSDFEIKNNTFTISTIHKSIDDWGCTTHNVQESSGRLILLPNSDVVFVENNTTLVKINAQGVVIWKIALAPGKYSPYLACDSEGRVVVSMPNNRHIIVLNPDGGIYAEFPSRFLHDPAGVCVDSYGRVLVADKAQKVVSIFRMNGNYVARLTKIESDARSMKLFNDKYLVIGTSKSGIYLYELEN